jgi:hypothetical protein
LIVKASERCYKNDGWEGVKLSKIMVYKYQSSANKV